MSYIETHPLKNSTIMKINADRNLIDTNPEYQRSGEIWTLEKRQLLIDSILNDYDIPKIYFHLLTNDKKYEYAIIDGRQRLETIWSFIDGKFSLADDFEYFNNKKIKAAGLTYSDLAKNYPKLKIDFDSFVLPIIYVVADDVDLIDDMFSRLNEAVPLNAAEKRNAFSGEMVKIIRSISSHKFFTNKVKFKNNRYQYHEVSARLLYIEYHLKKDKKIYDTKKPYLDSFVKKFKTERKELLNEAKSIKKTTSEVLDEMNNIFINEDTLLISQAYIPIYYLLIKHAKDNGLLPQITRNKFIQFRKDLSANKEIAEKDITKANYDFIQFDQMSRQGTNDAPSIRERDQILKKYFGFIS